MILTCARHDGFTVSYEANSYSAECPCCNNPIYKRKFEPNDLEILKSEVRSAIRILLDAALYG